MQGSRSKSFLTDYILDHGYLFPEDAHDVTAELGAFLGQYFLQFLHSDATLEEKKTALEEIAAWLRTILAMQISDFENVVAEKLTDEHTDAHFQTFLTALLDFYSLESQDLQRKVGLFIALFAPQRD